MNNPIQHYDLYPDDVLFWRNDNKEYRLTVEHDEDVSSPRGSDCCNICDLYCSHPRHSLGDYDRTVSHGEWWHDLIQIVPRDVLAARLAETQIPDFEPDDPETLVDDFLDAVQDESIPASICIGLLKDYAVVMPVWIYEHSGIVLSAGGREYPFNDRFDSGQVGWIAVAKKAILDNFPKEDPAQWEARARGQISAEIETYNQWLRNDIYWFLLASRDIDTDPDQIKHETRDADWDEIDSCGGFYGTDLFTNGMLEHVSNGLKQALESDQYRTGTCESYKTVVHVYKEKL